MFGAQLVNIIRNINRRDPCGKQTGRYQGEINRINHWGKQYQQKPTYLEKKQQQMLMIKI